MASTTLLLWAALSLSGISFAEDVDWANAGTFFGQPLDGNGPYGFGGCNATQLTALHALFNEAGSALEHQIIPEVNKGNKSSAFNTFFSTMGSEIPPWSQNGLSVPQEVFSDIDNGPVNRTIDNLQIANGGPVIFACRNDADPANPDLNPSASEANIKCAPNIAAARFRLNELDTSDAHWLLCDRFWDDAVYPNMPLPQMCPSYNETYQQFVASDGNQVKDTRLGLVIQMLAQVYSQNIGANRADLQDLNQAIIQDYSTEIANPTNYDWFGTMVAANCTEWPSWADPNFNETAADSADEAAFEAAIEANTTDSDAPGTKRRSVSIRGRPVGGLLTSNEEPKVLEARANHRTAHAPALKADPRLSIGGRLGTIEDVPDAVKVDLKKLANIRPSGGKLDMSGKKAMEP